MLFLKLYLFAKVVNVIVERSPEEEEGHLAGVTYFLNIEHENMSILRVQFGDSVK